MQIGGPITTNRAGENIAHVPRTAVQLAFVLRWNRLRLSTTVSYSAGAVMAEKAIRATRVLVVDDSEPQVATLVDLLTTTGFAVRAAYHGRAALENVGDFQPDFAVIDISLPGMNGYELARRIRQQSPTTVLIAMTGWTREEDRVAAFRAGFDVHLNKPVPFPRLVSILNEGNARPSQIRRTVKLRDHPLTTRKSGVKTWPPLWSNIGGSEQKKPRGEVGRLKRVEHHGSIANSIFLWMEFSGETYVGMLNFDDGGFCDEISTVLQTHLGFDIQEIGALDLSCTLFL